MKVVTTTFFHDFSRYFQFLEGAILSSGKNASFFNISVYPSSHMFWKGNGKHSVLPWLSSSAELQVYNYNTHSELIDSLIYFNKRSLELFGIDEVPRLIKQAEHYLNALDSIFKREQFDILISSGESRLIPSVVIYLAKKYNVRIIFFEQGPFGTTIFDGQGVNANISFKPSFRRLSDYEDKKLADFIGEYKEKSSEKYWLNGIGHKEKLWNTVSLLLMHPPSFLKAVMPVDLWLGEGFYRGYLKPKLLALSKKNIREQVEEIECSRKYVALYLQVPVDAQLIEHSPYYSDFYRMLIDVLEAKPVDFDLIIREHPQYRGKYDARIYEIVRLRDDVYLGNFYSLKELVVHSACTVVNNSAVGIESILLGINVVCLGSSYYSHKGITYDYNGSNLTEIISLAINEKFQEVRVKSFLYELCFEYLQPGHFQDTNLVFPTKLLSMMDAYEK